MSKPLLVALRVPEGYPVFQEDGMRKALLGAATSALAIASVLSAQWTQPPRVLAQQKPEPALKLKVGDTAPDFGLKYFDGKDLKDVHLSDYHGKKNVVLAFYIFAFTGG
jgi:hypothetical protein